MQRLDRSLPSRIPTQQVHGVPVCSLVDVLNDAKKIYGVQ